MRPKGLEGANWTGERKEILRLMAPTHSASKIAEALGCGFTRNMVLGKCRRMHIGLEWWPRRPPARRRKAEVDMGRPPVEPSMKPKRVRKPESKAVQEKPKRVRKPESKAIQEKPWKPSGILLRCGWVGW